MCVCTLRTGMRSKVFNRGRVRFDGGSFDAPHGRLLRPVAAVRPRVHRVRQVTAEERVEPAELPDRGAQLGG